MQTDIKTYERVVSRGITQALNRTTDTRESFRNQINRIGLDTELYTTSELEEIIENIEKNVEKRVIYLNPLATVLGYYVIRNRKIDENLLKLNNIQHINALLLEFNVSRIDIIRYAKLWLKIIGSEVEAEEEDEIDESYGYEEEKSGEEYIPYGSEEEKTGGEYIPYGSEEEKSGGEYIGYGSEEEKSGGEYIGYGSEEEDQNYDDYEY